MVISKEQNHSTRFKLLILIPLIILLYLVMNQYVNVGILSASMGKTYSVKIFLDDWIPFVPHIIVIYLLWLFFPAAGLIFAYYKKITANELIALYVAHILLLISCYAIYLIFPVSAESIMVKATKSDLANSLGLWAMTTIYGLSTPYNAFPSYHVAPMVLVSIFLFYKWRTLFWISLPLAILIASGTVLTRFHFVADILGGIMMGIFAYYVLYERASLKCVKKFVQVKEGK